MNRRGVRYDMPLAQPPAAPNLEQRGSQFGSTTSAPSNSQKGFVDSLTSTTGAIDEWLGELGQPLKPYLPAIGRILVVLTFIEDAVRIITQWGDQTRYLRNYRGIPYFLTVLLLASNVICMFVGSYCVISKRFLLYGTGALTFVVVSQALAYGLLLDVQFFSRNLSLIGGLLMVVSDAFVQEKRRMGLPGLPQLDNKDRARYIKLAGRVLLVFLFLGHLVRTKWTITSSLFNVIAISCCILVAIGYKARLSASLLSIVLFCQNLWDNPYWNLDRNHPNRDFLRYAHFQTLSIVGGLILLINMGAGRISIDEKKKIY
ncbi:Surfeit locus protein 4 [Wickerhamiella sorbophila]|uniref:Surfeit locus protein 4 n=1 Tax=Wickerhamiella sorbophila TaxID=45607 RepID=A0A2T0FFH7_9ASCO|nr:Surfeit locus protein 4 [Wickerhamiella sorbophila]PRT53709.1 Surfeit locus protein 4 [Wickerhamiella sorbophila]